MELSNRDQSGVLWVAGSDSLMQFWPLLVSSFAFQAESGRADILKTIILLELLSMGSTMAISQPTSKKLPRRSQGAVRFAPSNVRVEGRALAPQTFVNV
jgi:hypothetical protein